jgi:beta-galactosidase
MAAHERMDPAVPQLPSRVLFGAAYYNEYHQTDRLKVDLDLMRDAHFSVIRVGESVWSTWEPENGRFDLDWLQPVLDGAAEREISVIIGTPSYAIPPWLARTYPEIAAESSTGSRVSWGARQEVDFTHAAFRFHAERVIRRVIERYADHPAVIGYQVDNEPGLQLFHNHGVFQRFIDWLRGRYGDVETLNQEWGLVYWSHRLSTWADLWTPDGNVQPQYDVAWRRFQAEQTTDFIAWQAAIVREYATPSQFVTTCIAYERPAVDDDRVTDTLDISSGNAYYRMQGGLARPEVRDSPEQGWTTDGTAGLYLTADRMFSSRQAPFLVTETNAMHIGQPWDSRPAYDGQWRQAAWALVSRGATMIEYWHWHTLPFGAETYWGGVLPHSGLPGRAYEEIATLGQELALAAESVGSLIPDAEVAMLYSLPSKWLMQKYPALMTDSGGPDSKSYAGLFDPFYRGAFDAGLQTRILHTRQLVGDVECDGPSDPAEYASAMPVLVAAGHYISDDATLDWLAAYAAAGGHLVLGPRTGYADLEGRARLEVAPPRLSEAAGVWYDEFSNLVAPCGVHSVLGSPLGLPSDAQATRWVDGLHVLGAEILAEYDHAHFGRWPAITSNAHGRGRVTCLGTVPGPSLAKAVFDWIGSTRPRVWLDLPPTVTATSGVGASGQRVHFVHNWSWESTDVVLPLAARDLLQGTDLPEGAALPLGPWDVRVLAEAPAAGPEL